MSATAPSRGGSAATRARQSRARRATTDADKQLRRDAILARAESHLREVGFEAFSMECLASELGLARGTLYRYFATREELLLSLCERQLDAFVEALVGAVAVGVSDKTFIRRWYRESVRDALLLELLARLGSVIEHNVPVATLVATKRHMHDVVTRLSAHVAKCLELDDARSRHLIAALTALMLGASQIDASPQLDRRRLPAPVREAQALFNGETVFCDNALLILRGIRQP